MRKSSRRQPDRAAAKVPSLADERYHTEHRTADRRTPAQIDRDRILYSTAFARLAEVTQVVSADRGHVFHNRLTHSLKVAQLARRLAEFIFQNQPAIAKKLNVSPDVAEAAALAHDLGHPPFGHIAEEELNKLAKKAGLTDGFEGNAQSLRIVTKLTVGDTVHGNGVQIGGLNLTRATVNGILKYPWFFGEKKDKKNKWGAYKTERDLFSWARRSYSGDARPKKFQRSAEAELMDWADDITYAVHDLVDFYCAGKIPLDRLADPNDGEREIFLSAVFKRKPKWAKRRAALQDAFVRLLELFPFDRRYEGTLEQRCTLWQFSTVLISRYVKEISLTDDGSSFVEINQRAEDEIEMLKQLTWHYVILNDDLATEQHGQRRIVRDVFDAMLKAIGKDGDLNLFPVIWRDDIKAAKTVALKKRLVVDYVAGLTEREISKCHGLLTARPGR